MRDIFFSKIETKIDDIRNLSHENLISELMNSNDHYVDLRFISSRFEMQAYTLKIICDRYPKSSTGREW